MTYKEDSVCGHVTYYFKMQQKLKYFITPNFITINQIYLIKHENINASIMTSSDRYFQHTKRKACRPNLTIRIPLRHMYITSRYTRSKCAYIPKQLRHYIPLPPSISPSFSLLILSTTRPWNTGPIRPFPYN
jgi:hypothetical protein